jgi:large subunit ribosomal protein L7Ae
MSKPYYVKFETPKDLVSAVYEAVRLAKQSGKVRKGTNEVVAHLPILCEERNTAYIFVPSKQQLGASLGIDVGSAAATILEAGEAQHIVEQVVNSIANMKGKK